MSRLGKQVSQEKEEKELQEVEEQLESIMTQELETTSTAFVTLNRQKYAKQAVKRNSQKTSRMKRFLSGSKNVFIQ